MHWLAEVVDCSRGPAGCGTPAHGGPPAPPDRRRRKQGSPVCPQREQFHRWRRTWLPDRGTREILNAGAGCHAAPQAQGILAAVDTGGRPENGGSASLRLRAATDARESSDCGQSSVSQLKLSVVPGESTSSRRQSNETAKPSSTLAKSMNSCPSWQ